MDHSPTLIVACTIFGESRGLPVEAQIGVACVLHHRLKSGRWGTTWEEVCWAKQQFSCWTEKDPNRPLLLALLEGVGDQLRGPDAEAWAQAQWIAEGIIRGAIRDRVSGATHYHANTMKTPKWAEGKTPVCVLPEDLKWPRKLLFYAGVR